MLFADMSSIGERMDGFNQSERIVALKQAKEKMEEYLEIFKQEEIDAFKLVADLDEQLGFNSTPHLIERRRQKFVWASGLKLNVMSQQKQIEACERAIAEEECRLITLCISHHGRTPRQN